MECRGVLTELGRAGQADTSTIQKRIRQAGDVDLQIIKMDRYFPTGSSACRLLVNNAQTVWHLT